MSYDQYEYQDQNQYPEEYEYQDQNQYPKEYEYQEYPKEYEYQYVEETIQLPVISVIQDSNITFPSNDQNLCNDCVKNSNKDPYFPILSLATDPSWIIMSCGDNLFLQCSHT